MQKSCHCEAGAHTGCGNPSPCAVPLAPANASGGALSASSGRKCPKNAAKTHGFGILSAAEVTFTSVHFRHANRDMQISYLAFASSLRLIPRRAPRLCWPIETGSLCVCRAAGSAPHPPRQGTRALPYKPSCRAAPMCAAARSCAAPMQKPRHCEASDRCHCCGNPHPLSFRSFPGHSTQAELISKINNPYFTYALHWGILQHV